MSQKTSVRRRKTTQSDPFAFLRRPAVQLGLLGIAVLVVVALILSGNAENNGKLGATISPQQAYALYQNGEAFFLDVREQEEWNEYHAPNTTLIPLGQLAARVGEIPVPKDAPIVVVCRSGNRSDEGRDILRRAGFTNVTSMDGGLKTWRELGYPIEP
ncbi:MAG: rhodanese-like domain-containing protein [Anaerolineales bacterium]|nr:rhodanese-like domain-containing protein [Anaerolineales bacterium]MCX7755102.1 rhodanese-like domain-containing protein [Anaerolineales bacterium]MDW8277545.1 rhodanese-like domain-containing protein [Anaerolineales bacterium]